MWYWKLKEGERSVHHTYYPNSGGKYFPNFFIKPNGFLFSKYLAMVSQISDHVPNIPHIFTWGFTGERFAWFSTSSPSLLPPGLPEIPSHPARALLSILPAQPALPIPTSRRTWSFPLSPGSCGPHSLILLIFHRHLFVFPRYHCSLLIGKGFLLTFPLLISKGISVVRWKPEMSMWFIWLL